MKFSVHHTTRYDYSVPVGLGRHIVRLVPQGEFVRTFRHELNVSPRPTGQSEQQDAHGNRFMVVDFQGETSQLSIESVAEAWIERPPPVFDPGWARLPWGSAEGRAAVAPAVGDFAHRIAAETAHQVGSFLHRLNQELFQRTDRRIRLEGAAQSPLQTLTQRVGACRDLTVLFLECCRAVGLEGRFVSGYQSTAETPDGQRHLHAWAEVLLPGLGSRGFDPTHGLPVEDGHLPLCAAPTQAETMPVEGSYTFRGTTLSTTLSYSVQISTSA